MKPSGNILFNVRRIRVELTRHFWHYLLRVARLPISPPAPQKWMQRYKRFLNLKVFFSNYYIKRHCSLPIIDFENHIGLGIIYLDADILQIFGIPVIAAFY